MLNLGISIRDLKAPYFSKEEILLLAHLELCSKLAYAMACCPSSDRRPSARPSLAFHFFDISSRTISWNELKLSVEALWQHGDSELLKSFRSDIQDGHHLENL